jgi:hypothetical protein
MTRKSCRNICFMFHGTLKIHMKHLSKNTTSKLNSCNICVKHMQHHNIQIYFATSKWNTCNILSKHLKHVGDMHQICTKLAWCPSWMSSVSSDPNHTLTPTIWPASTTGERQCPDTLTYPPSREGATTNATRSSALLVVGEQQPPQCSVRH